jgi:hypothetical protein
MGTPSSSVTGNASVLSRSTRPRSFSNASAMAGQLRLVAVGAAAPYFYQRERGRYARLLNTLALRAKSEEARSLAGVSAHALQPLSGSPNAEIVSPPAAARVHFSSQAIPCLSRSRPRLCAIATCRAGCCCRSSSRARQRSYPSQAVFQAVRTSPPFVEVSGYGVTNDAHMRQNGRTFVRLRSRWWPVEE